MSVSGNEALRRHRSLMQIDDSNERALLKDVWAKEADVVMKTEKKTRKELADHFRICMLLFPKGLPEKMPEDQFKMKGIKKLVSLFGQCGNANHDSLPMDGKWIGPLIRLKNEM